MGDTPKVSIGLPVYNGETYIAEALESLLAQTFADFEVILADNCSTDRTGEICREFAARDPRIRYIRHDRNLGAAANHNFVFTASIGEYFKLAAHDDVLHPQFLERCVDALDGDPRVVLACSRTMQIDESGRQTRGIDERPLRMGSPRAWVRFGDISCTRHAAVRVFGLFRRAAIPGGILLGRYVGSDRTLLAELALVGPWKEFPEYLFFRRDHKLNSTKEYKSEYSRIAWFDPSMAGRIIFPTWRRLGELLKAVDRSPIAPREKLACKLQFVRWLFTDWPRVRAMMLARDLVVGGWMAVQDRAHTRGIGSKPTEAH